MDLAYSLQGNSLPMAASDNPDAPRFFFEVDNRNFQTFSLFCKVGLRGVKTNSRSKLHYCETCKIILLIFGLLLFIVNKMPRSFYASFWKACMTT